MIIFETVKKSHVCSSLAESEGFKPPIPVMGIPDFESSAFDHSANFPQLRCKIRHFFYICKISGFFFQKKRYICNRYEPTIS